MSKYNEAFARRLKVGRAEKGWTQQQLAQKSKIDVHTIQSYELGRRMPSLEKALVFADIFGWPLDYLVDRNVKDLGHIPKLV